MEYKKKSIKFFEKRIFDIFFSTVGLIVISPILLISSVLIKLDSKGPIFFKQKRVGKYGKIFKILKFRTMVINAENLGRKITVGRDPRITRIGYFLRKYKVDELPQLINVFMGDMSFVGPRPEVPKYVNLYTKNQKKILNIKPGITDIASIKYKNESEILGKVENPERYYKEVIMQDKIKLNFEYMKDISVVKDVKVILKTISICLR